MNTGAADDTGQQPEVAEATLPVIAVFGGAKDQSTLKAAGEIGYQIGLNQAILLTGGDDPNAGDLKACALAGTLRARKGGAKAPWIGVLRGDPTYAANGLSLVLAPGGNHRRNYAEADLCDVAIVFEGGDGTSSELVFCLALGKPLVLVGDCWLSKYPVVSTGDARDGLRKEAQQRVPLPHAYDNQRLGLPIREAYEKLDRIVDPSFQHFALPPKASASAVVKAAVTSATETRSRPVEPTANLSPERAAIQQFRASFEAAH